ncbi:patatin-like phospholipase family protein [Streptomyces sp. NPDC059639]|uniref:patatin-like phospholipase family protein n=1 Tax=Streptomyces sp. NPDC059639 TaxID=3346891 RepID=UPI0036B7B05B
MPENEAPASFSASGEIGVVVAGGGARGAYEAGMLATLLPELDRFGQRPTLFTGTSAGALNAVLFASFAHLPAHQAADEVIAAWQGLTKDQVFRPFLLTALPSILRQCLTRVVNPSSAPLAGLLDTSPLRTTLRTKVDWNQLHANLADGAVQAVAVATTAFGSGRTEVFAEGPAAARLPASDADRAVDYTRTVLNEDHVMASAAIPVAFPPVRIGPVGCWYMDGGVRLNAPIKPTISLGARRVVIVATTPLRDLPHSTDCQDEPVPSVQDVVAQILTGLMGDRMVEDTRTLGKVDELLESGAKRISPRGRPYTVIEYLFGGPLPGQADQLGEKAEYVLDTSFRGVRRLTNPDLMFLAALLGPGQSRGELLSYLFFEPEFIGEAIKLGQRDARIILDEAGDDPGKLWRTDAA